MTSSYVSATDYFYAVAGGQYSPADLVAEARDLGQSLRDMAREIGEGLGLVHGEPVDWKLIEQALEQAAREADAEADEFDAEPELHGCGGMLMLLGSLGRLNWFRCRGCGMDMSREA